MALQEAFPHIIGNVSLLQSDSISGSPVQDSVDSLGFRWHQITLEVVLVEARGENSVLVESPLVIVLIRPLLIVKSSL